MWPWAHGRWPVGDTGPCPWRAGPLKRSTVYGFWRCVPLRGVVQLPGVPSTSHPSGWPPAAGPSCPRPHALRLPTYRAMGAAVLGPRGGAAIEALQFFINLGCIITNTILSGQMMQHTYAILCGGEAAVA